MEETKYCFLQFKFFHHTSPGEEIFITGSTPSLGNWNIDQSERMVTSSNEYPLWKSKENIKVAQNSEIQYKYLIFKNGKFLQWEKTENNQNRKIKVNNYFRLVVLDPGSKIEKYTPAFVTSSPTQSNDSISDMDFEFNKDFNIKNDSDINDNNNSELNEDELQNVLPELNYDDSINVDIAENIDVNYDDRSSVNNSTDDIIVVSFYLPINACKNNNDERWRLDIANEPFYHALTSIINSNENVNIKNIKWIGLLKNESKISSNEIKEELYDKLKTHYNMYPMSINENLYKSLFTLFNYHLEPLIHYVTTPDIITDIKTYEGLFASYRAFNELIANSIINLLSSTRSTLIMLNDYHFFFVPSLLYSMLNTFHREETLQKISIGSFVHCPFPSVDVFKKLPYREEILQSMMNCAVIGFHTYYASQNFIRAAKVIIGVDSASTLQGDIALTYMGRKLIVRVANITPEPSMLYREIETSEFNSMVEAMRKGIEEKFVFVSIDNMQFMSGISMKLIAFQRFLSCIDREYISRIVFLLYIRMSSDDIDANGNLILSSEQSALLSNIKSLTKQITDEHGDVLRLEIKSITYTERLSLFKIANCFIRTSKRESFSLGIYEYLLIKIHFNDTKHVEYMISALSGVNALLAHTIKINPYDINSIANGFLSAYQPIIDEREGDEDKEKDFAMVKRSSTIKWFWSFINDIKKYKNEEMTYMGSGMGLNFKLIQTRCDFKPMNKSKIINNYENSNRRLVFFNFGTKTTKDISSLHSIINLLEALSSDPHNKIYFLSSLSGSQCASLFGDHLIDVIPDSGKWYRGTTSTWIIEVTLLLKDYAEKCEGATVIEKDISVLFDYKDSDPEFGKMLACAISNEIDNMEISKEVQVIQYDNCLEVRDRNVNKGNFASRVIKKYINTDGKAPEFILAIGNECSDEKMFSYFKEKKKEIEKYMRYQALYSIVIGKKASNAMCYANTVGEVINLLEEFVKASQKKTISKSTLDINTLLSSNNSKDISFKSGGGD